MKKNLICILAITTSYFLLTTSGLFADVRINSVSGEVTVNGASAIVGQQLILNDVIKTSAASNSIIIINGHEVTVSEKTEVAVNELTEDSSLLKVWLGKIRAKVQKLKAKQKFEIKTPVAIVAVRGTDFAIEVAQDGFSHLEVYEGVVSAKEETTGGEVLVNPGEFTTVQKGEAPAEPKALEGEKVKSETEEKKEDFKSEAQREIFMEISRDAVKERAADEIKLAEYQNGKVLMDFYGKRVRLEEYVYRPPENKNQFKYVVLNERENRFDFGKILFTFNDVLPTNLNDATKNMFHSEGSTEPELHIINLDSVMSNTYDKILEEATDGKMVADDSTSPTSWSLFFGNYKFYIGNADSTENGKDIGAKLMWEFKDNGDNQAKPDEFTYIKDTSILQTNGFENISETYLTHTDPAVSTVNNMPDGNTTFHFAYKDLYADGTTVEKHNYIINDDGKVQTFSDIASSETSADEIKEKILTLNFENVYTSSLFQDKYSTDDGFGKRIDLIFSSKLLSDAGLLQLPSSLSQ